MLSAVPEKQPPLSSWHCHTVLVRDSHSVAHCEGQAAQCEVEGEADSAKEDHTAVSDGLPAAIEKGSQQRETASHGAAAAAWYAAKLVLTIASDPPPITARMSLAGTRARVPGSASSCESSITPRADLNTNGAQRLKLAKGCHATWVRPTEIQPS